MKICVLTLTHLDAYFDAWLQKWGYLGGIIPPRVSAFNDGMTCLCRKDLTTQRSWNEWKSTLSLAKIGNYEF